MTRVTLALLQHPEEPKRLRAQPTLIETAVEGLLRFASPVETSAQRFAMEDIDLHGIRIARGSIGLGIIASANGDDRKFVGAQIFDIGRDRNKLGYRRICRGTRVASSPREPRRRAF